MHKDPRPQLVKVIRELRQLKEISAVAIIRRDGLVIAHDLPSSSDPRRVAAMSAAIVGTGELAAEELGQGRFLRSVIGSDAGKILSTGAGEDAILMTLVKENCNVGLLLMALDKAAGQLSRILSTGIES